MPSKKKYNARFPPARIKKIMQTDEDIGKVAAPVPVLISKALEIFLESLITKSSHQTQIRNAKTMTAAHIKQGIQSESTFDFLKDQVEDVPDIAQEEEEEEFENNHLPTSAASNHRHAGGETTGFSRSSSTASSSSVTETPPKRRRGRPRKQPESQAGPSKCKHSQLATQTSEETTTSEDSELSDGEIPNHGNSMSPAICISQTATSQTRQENVLSHMAKQGQESAVAATHGIPIMPRFQIPAAPSNSSSLSFGMGLYQMPKTCSTVTGQEEYDEEDYDT